MANDNAASTNVVSRCGQIVPDDIQPQTRSPMSLGLLKKNESRMPVRAPHSHAISSIMPEEQPPEQDAARRFRSAAHGSPGACPRFVALQHFLPQIAPDRREQLVESSIQLDVDQISGTVEIHRIAADDTAGGTGRQHEHFVRQRDGLFQVVRDEDDGLVRVCPEPEEL